MQALVVAARSHTPELSLPVLERTALSGAQCEKMLQDAREGEARLADNDDTRVRLRRLLNLPDRTVAPVAAAKAVTPDGQKVGRRAPGVRHPRRDPIGLPRHAGEMQVARA
jgi:hypothetical protein